ncbi:MAG: class I SAM-dependent methyltransferase [Syntrophaceae bacterium]|nr:class I SAM-dependent methyltransferase [Syntrophaceae bacterium]
MNKELSKIDICFAVDDNYAEHCAVVIASILLNSNSLFHFYILYYQLSPKNKIMLDNLKRIKIFELTFVKVSLKDFEGCFLHPDAHFNINTYFRLRIASLLPSVNKIIYLDADIIANHDLKELWDISFDNAYIIACKASTYKSNSKRLGLTTAMLYINTGVMVLNLKKIRDDSLEKSFFKCIKQKKEILKYADQDVINLVLSEIKESIKHIQQNWNVEDAACLSYEEDYLPILHSPYIIHFITGEKPWQSNSKQLYKYKYWQYRREVMAVNPSKLIMTLLVRNEEDIVRYNIDFHLSKGVDFIIATDNGSTDSTRDILKEYEERGVLHLIDEKNHDHTQAQWNNLMARIARDQYGADFIFHCDADEFWYPRSGNLKDEISKRPEDILVVDVVNVLFEDKGGEEKFPEDTRFAIVNPIVAKDYQEETKKTNLFYFKYPPKVIFKTKNKMLFVSQGNHTVTNKDDSVEEGEAHDIMIFHYPVRSKEHFIKKIIRSGAAYENNKIAGKDAGFHIKKWYASYKQGSLDEEYKKLILDEAEINNLLCEGFIEELDFEEIILGQKKSPGNWCYFNRRFEYENAINLLDSGWWGHYCFTYDLVRNTKPGKIVELGTQRGHSFFSFCQAVKDGFLNTQLFAVDTWEGDKHTGLYDESVWYSVNNIKNEFFGGLSISFLRKTFDEAADDFKEESIDILHIDGYHTYEAVKNDFERWIKKVNKNGIILFHDIFVKKDDFGVCQLWSELKKRYNNFEFYHSNGLGVLFKGYRSFAELFDYPSQ